MKSFTIDFDDRNEKTKLWRFLKVLKGTWQVVINETEPYQYRGRYKYYFAHVLRVIEENCLFVRESSGAPLPSSEIHEILKRIFNPEIFVNSETGDVYQGSKSTTGLKDGDFINKYEQAIISMFASDPYNLEFIDREIWTQTKINRHG